MKRFRSALASAALCLAAVFSSGQSLSFTHLGIDNGLSQQSVNSIHVDENGFIWIGTNYGLNCFDGKTVTTFLSDRQDSGTLLNNNVSIITGDGSGKLFILCIGGISQYDLHTRKFSTLRRGNINSIFYSDALYICEENKILKYDELTGEAEVFFRFEDESLFASTMSIYGSTIYIGTYSDGLYALDIETRSLSHLIEKANIISIFRDSKRNIWTGTFMNGLFKISKDGKTTNYRHQENDPTSISSDFVRACREDDLGNIWIGTINGLNKYLPEDNIFVNNLSEYSYKQELSHPSIWSIAKDNQGTIWIGTYLGGVNYFNPEHEIYTRYAHMGAGHKPLGAPVVSRIIEGEEDDFWIATEEGLLHLKDKKTGEYEFLRHDSGRNSLSHDNIKALYFDAERNCLWIGTYLRGLDKYDFSTRRFTHYRHDADDPETIPSDIIRDIDPYQGRLIVSTHSGICLFDPGSGKSERLLKDLEESKDISIVPNVLVDNDGGLWVIGYGVGVFKYSFDTGAIVKYKHEADKPNSLSSNYINTIFKDSMGRIWLASSDTGIDLFHPKTQDFTNINVHNSNLLSDCVYDIRESAISGDLLVITNSGLSIFNPEEMSFRNYDSSKGLPLSSIHKYGLMSDEDGCVLLGGNEGLVSFNEKDLRLRPKPYRIVLTDLIVNGEVVEVGDETGILDKALSYSSGITLKSRQDMLTVEFATTNYLPSNETEIVYKLAGFSDEWNSTRGDDRITYTNLKPGRYTLTISPGEEALDLCQPVQLDIRVLPPYYQTTLAYLIYAILSALGFLYLKRLYKVRIQLQESLRYEQKRLEDIEELNLSKLRFFTNVSHEFRTPLTLIVAEVESLMHLQKYTPTIYNKILSIYKNSVQLRELITELLDFRKVEQGHLRLKVSCHNLVDFLRENHMVFERYAVAKNIKFDFVEAQESIEVWFDPKQLQKVINNLVSNAFKFTPSSGRITLSVSCEAGWAVFSVKDTGSGIPSEDRERVFDRFHQVSQTESSEAVGTGIGLALTKGIVELHHGTISLDSELGKGSEFTVRLPLGQDHFTPEQIVKSPDAIRKETYLVLDTDDPANEERPKPKNGMKLLIVEDNEQIKETLHEVFSPMYDVITASDGEEGWRLVVSEMPVIVVSDVMMPRMSGIDLCKKIKTELTTCHIPVVLLTARTAIEHNLEGLRIGADDYITKPFSTSLLVARCNNLVNSRIILQEKFSKQVQMPSQVLATNALDKKILDKAVSIIDKHLPDCEFSVEVFAREMSMSRTNLFSKFKAITGQTPNEYIMTIRLKKAAVMLKSNPELNVTEISELTGFSSARYFSKCFKDTYHISPLAYRNGKDPELE